jgi:hypothetical protein
MPNVGAESTNELRLLESTQGILNTFCAKPMVPTMNVTECAIPGVPALGGQKFFDPVGQGLKFKVRPWALNPKTPNPYSSRSDLGP